MYLLASTSCAKASTCPRFRFVAILDADKEGFLRSHRSLTQTVGRAARNLNGEVIMYADKITDSMRLTIEETERRRAIQLAYNEAHGITRKLSLKRGIRLWVWRKKRSTWTPHPVRASQGGSRMPATKRATMPRSLYRGVRHEYRHCR